MFYVVGQLGEGGMESQSLNGKAQNKVSGAMFVAKLSPRIAGIHDRAQTN